MFFDVKNVGFNFNPVPDVIDRLYYPGTEQMDVLARSLLQDYQTTMDCLCFFFLRTVDGGDFFFFKCCEHLELLMTSS